MSKNCSFSWWNYINLFSFCFNAPCRGPSRAGRIWLSYLRPWGMEGWVYLINAVQRFCIQFSSPQTTCWWQPIQKLNLHFAVMPLSLKDDVFLTLMLMRAQVKDHLSATSVTLVSRWSTVWCDIGVNTRVSVPPTLRMLRATVIMTVWRQTTLAVTVCNICCENPVDYCYCVL